MPRRLATLTGLEPATSAVTGRRANQLRHRALLCNSLAGAACTPYGIRTRATALKGRRPRPLDEGGQIRISPGYSQRDHVGSVHSLGYRHPNPQTGCRYAPRRRCAQGTSILFIRAPIAQLVELRTFNPQVPGSSPGGGTVQRWYLARLNKDHPSFIHPLWCGPEGLRPRYARGRATCTCPESSKTWRGRVGRHPRARRARRRRSGQPSTCGSCGW
jgi:hypothetical protein